MLNLDQVSALSAGLVDDARILSDAQTLSIGANLVGNRNYAGLLDDLRIYNTALFQNEIALLVDDPLEPQTIWGLKTHDPVSQPPTALFRFDSGGTGYAELGTVKLGATEIEADALARSPSGVLFGFQVNVNGGSRLLAINPTNAAATVIGPVLANRDIRGACFTLSGRLLAFDNTAPALLEVDPATGQIAGAPVPIQGGPPNLGSTGDLTQAPDGTLLFAENAQIHRLDPRRGWLTALLTDTNTLADGYLPYCCGLACAPGAIPDDQIFGYEASIHDDVYVYRPASAFARTQLFDNVVPSYNAGRGDLAALPGARVELLSFSLSGATASLQTVCRGGAWAAVEFCDDLARPNWQEVPGSRGWIPITSGTIATPKTWSDLLADAQHRFYRVQIQ